MQNEAMRVLPVVLLLLKAPTLCLQPQRMSFFFPPTANGRCCHFASLFELSLPTSSPRLFRRGCSPDVAQQHPSCCFTASNSW